MEKDTIFHTIIVKIHNQYGPLAMQFYARYHSPGSGSAINNLKNRCRNFRKIFFLKNIFLHGKNIFSHCEKESLGKYS
jgi:hypothetical protein